MGEKKGQNKPPLFGSDLYFIFFLQKNGKRRLRLLDFILVLTKTTIVMAKETFDKNVTSGERRRSLYVVKGSNASVVERSG